jgi:hypothetical protein
VLKEPAAKGTVLDIKAFQTDGLTTDPTAGKKNPGR